MKIKITNKIYITSPSCPLGKSIEKALTLENPMFAQMAKRCKYAKDPAMRRRFRRALFGIKQNFKFYEENNGTYIIGRGCEGRLNRTVSREKTEGLVEYDLIDEKCEKFLHGEIKLRDYQEGIIEDILKSNTGVLKLSTGWGKSSIALKLIEAVQQPTLIICHQDKEVAKYQHELLKHYNYKAGIIKGEKIDIKQVTIASVSTLTRRDLSSISKKFSMVIVDECQLYVSDKRIEAVQSFNPKRLYGMSGTPERDDGLTNAIFFTFGDIIVDKQLPQVSPRVMVVKSNVPIPVDEYADMIADMVQDTDRNDLICQTAKNEIEKGRKIIVLTKRTVHYGLLNEKLRVMGYKCHCIQSGLNVEDMKKQVELLENLGNGDINFDVILGTYSLLAVGTNIPALDTIIFAGDLRAKVLSSQAIGRILRLFSGKQTPLVIDIDDILNPILHSQARARRQLYRQNNWEII